METSLALLPTSLAQLSQIGEFLGVARADTFYSSEVTISCSESVLLYVVLKRSRRTALDDGVGLGSPEICPVEFAEKGALLPVIRTLAACPTWTHGQFSFYNLPDLDEVTLEVFALLRSCRSLSSLRLSSGRNLYSVLHRQYSPCIHLSTLVGGNPFLETLEFDLDWGEDIQKYAEIICEYLSRNSVLKSFTSGLHHYDIDKYPQAMETLLRPFTSTSQTEANDVLKELVIRAGERGEEAIASLVRYNTTLEKLEFRLSYRIKDIGCKLIARALEVNHTLKEFRFECSIAEMKELVRVLIPDVSGHQPNTSLSSLTLFPRDCLGANFMDELASMFESNTTLEHVQVSRAWLVWDLGNSYSRRYVECKTRDKLELMMNNELRLNSSLQSLVVGYWKLLRVGTQWHMTYRGPCFDSTIKEEFLVEVKMH